MAADGSSMRDRKIREREIIGRTLSPQECQSFAELYGDFNLPHNASSRRVFVPGDWIAMSWLAENGFVKGFKTLEFTFPVFLKAQEELIFSTHLDVNPSRKNIDKMLEHSRICSRETDLDSFQNTLSFFNGKYTSENWFLPLVHAYCSTSGDIYHFFESGDYDRDISNMLRRSELTRLDATKGYYRSAELSMICNIDPRNPLERELIRISFQKNESGSRPKGIFSFDFLFRQGEKYRGSVRKNVEVAPLLSSN